MFKIINNDQAVFVQVMPRGEFLVVRIDFTENVVTGEWTSLYGGKQVIPFSTTRAVSKDGARTEFGCHLETLLCANNYSVQHISLHLHPLVFVETKEWIYFEAAQGYELAHDDPELRTYLKAVNSTEDGLRVDYPIVAITLETGEVHFQFQELHAVGKVYQGSNQVVPIRCTNPELLPEDWRTLLYDAFSGVVELLVNWFIPKQI